MKMTQPLPGDVGLNLVDPESGLQPGELLRAWNLRSDAWGPRHGFTYLDRATRGRTHPDLDGASDYITLPYIAQQFALGTIFSFDLLIKVGALPSVNEGWLYGTDHATSRALDVYLGTDGTVSAYLKDVASNTETLTTTGTLSATDVAHIRVTREKDLTKLYLDTVLEDSGTSLSATSALATVAEDRFLGKTTIASTELFDGVICGCYLRSFVDEDFTYAYSELPHPRGSEVLGAWICELLDSDTTIFDASPFGNHGIPSGVGSNARVVEVHEPIQAFKHMTMRDGKRYNLVLVGGRLYAEAI